MLSSRHVSAALAVAASLLAACSDSTAPRQATRAVSLSVATTGGSVIGTGGAVTAGGIAIGGGDQLVITRAQLVLREIDLEGPALAASCSTFTGDNGASLSSANSTSSDDSASHDATDDHGDANCGEMELGPVMVELPMSAGVTQEIAVQIPEGTYHEIGFKLRAPDEDTGADAAFRVAHPELNGLSVRVEGTYNGQPFVWTSAVSAEKKLEFQPDLVVGAGGTNVTLAVNVASWFTDDAGQPVDPASAGAGTAARPGIEARIASSFGAFEDHDRDGHDDASEHH